MTLALSATTPSAGPQGPAASSSNEADPSGTPFEAMLGALSDSDTDPGSTDDTADPSIADPSIDDADDDFGTTASPASSRTARRSDLPDEAVAALFTFALPVPFDAVKVDPTGGHVDSNATTPDSLDRNSTDPAVEGSIANRSAAAALLATLLEGGQGNSAPAGALESADVPGELATAPDTAGTPTTSSVLRSATTPLAHAALADAAFRARLLQQLGQPGSPAVDTAPDDRTAGAKTAVPSSSLGVPTQSAGTASASSPLPSTWLPQASATDSQASNLAAQSSAAPVSAVTLARAVADAGGSSGGTTGFERRSGATPDEASVLLGVRGPQLASAQTTLEAALSKAAPTAEVPSLPNEAANTDSIVQTMRLQSQSGVSTAVVNLDPDYLGAVTVFLRVENGAVTATLHAENPQVRAWMEGHESVLRQGLAEQGLSLDRLQISAERPADEQSSADARRRQQPEQEPPPRAPRRAAAGTFEVVV